jgi:hypothetical protein
MGAVDHNETKNDTQTWNRVKRTRYDSLQKWMCVLVLQSYGGEHAAKLEKMRPR